MNTIFSLVLIPLLLFVICYTSGEYSDYQV